MDISVNFKDGHPIFYDMYLEKGHAGLFCNFCNHSVTSSLCCFLCPSGWLLGESSSEL